jgi:hypothetical protein
MNGPSGPPLSSSSAPLGSENFAPEPEDFAQVHKVFTQNLEWLKSDVEGLKRHTWRVPAAFGFSSVSFSVAVAGGLEIINHDGRASSAPLMDWLLLVVGLAVAGVCLVVGLLAVSDRNEDVDEVAGRVGDLKY